MIDKRTIKVALMLLLIFAAGGFCGWWIGSNGAVAQVEEIEPRPAGRRPAMVQKDRLVEEFTARLDLTAEQRANVDRVLTEWAGEIQRLNMQNLRGRHTLFDKYAPLVRTNLNSRQQRIYDRLNEQTRRRQRALLENQ